MFKNVRAVNLLKKPSLIEVTASAMMTKPNQAELPKMRDFLGMKTLTHRKKDS